MSNKKTYTGPMETKSCPKCNGSGWYAYDHNHSKPCEVCCTHDQGWWDLSEKHHGSKFIKGGDNGCCRNGCGTMRRDLQSKPQEKTTRISDKNVNDQ